MKKLLFTPGPLTTSDSVKKTMLTDYGSRDSSFIKMVQEIRSKLLQLAGVSKEDGYEAVLMQGSGTFGVEATITTAIPSNGHLLVIINGAYGERIAKIAEIAGIKYSMLKYAENEQPSLKDISGLLKNEKTITHVAVVQCETTTGIMNPVKEIGELVKKFKRVFIVDAMSSFGAVPVSMKDCGIDYLVSSANKCIEGVPGFSFALVKTDEFKKITGNARSLSLDLYAQWQGLENTGQFRFTPPTHAIAAFHQALKELQQEGGVAGRAKRYHENHQILIKGMRELGFKEVLEPEKQGYIITAFHYPPDPSFDFEKFYKLLNEKGFVIYPGKLSKIDCFRIGNIGRIFPNDIKKLLKGINEALKEMQVEMQPAGTSPFSGNLLN